MTTIYVIAGLQPANSTIWYREVDGDGNPLTAWADSGIYAGRGDRGVTVPGLSADKAYEFGLATPETVWGLDD